MKITKTLVLLWWLGLVPASMGQTVSTVFTNGLDEPYGIAVDTTTTNNFYYISDSVNGRIIQLTPATSEVLDLTGPWFGDPRGVVLARGGLVVADAFTHQIRQVGFAGGVPALLAGSTQGNADGNGAAAMFDTPTALAVDAAGNIYIADSHNNAVRKLDPLNNVTTYATGFKNPSGLAMSPDGHLFVADTGNNVIKVVHTNLLGSLIVELVAGTPGPSTSTDHFNAPRGLLWVGGRTGLLVCDTGNQVIRRVFSPFGSSAFPWTSVVFAGQPGVAGLADGDALTAARFHDPEDITLDAQGSIVIVDLKNNAIRRIVRPLVLTPTVVPAGGTFSNAVAVAATTTVTNATVRYTLDGSDPTPTSPVFPSTLTLDGGPTLPIPLKVQAFSPDQSPSTIVSNSFIFVVNTPTNSIASGAYTNDVALVVTSVTTNSVVHYTLDGTTPTASSPIWTNQVAPVVANENLADPGVYNYTFAAFRTGYSNSPPVQLNLTFSASLPIFGPIGPAGTFPPTNNPVDMFFVSGTSNVVYYFTLNGSDPVPSSGGVDTPVGLKVVWTNHFLLGTNTPVGGIVARATKPGYAKSGENSATFQLIVDPPRISAATTNSNNAIQVTLSDATVNSVIYWTIDGTDPVRTNTTPVNVTYFTNSNDGFVGTLYDPAAGITLGTNGTLKARAFRHGFQDSFVTNQTFTLAVAAPTLIPGAGTNINTVTVTVTNLTTGVLLNYTLDGSTPTTNHFAGQAANTFTLPITTNTSLQVFGLRNGFLPSSVVTSNYFIQVDKPTLSPSSGYFPNGTTVSLGVVRADATIYYTLDGVTDPTTNSIAYRGPFALTALTAPNGDLQKVKARAFAPNTLPSDLVTGQPLAASSIGIPRDTSAGVGSTVVVPVVINLNPNDSLLTAIFKVIVTPVNGAPPLTSSLQALATGPNDFVPMAGTASGNNPTTLSVASYTLGTSSIMDVSAIGTNANLVVKNFGTVAMLAISIPTATLQGSGYSIVVTNASGTRDANQGSVALSSMAPRQVLVTNLSYLVGDTAPGNWYNAGDFGNGQIDNADVNNAFYASLGVRVPYPFTDAFDAMDAYPEDSPTSVGGDGQIRYLDWQVILNRALRRETVNWSRSWTSNGVRTNAAATLTVAAQMPAQVLDNKVTGQIWPDVEISANSVDQARPGGQVSVPVYVNVVNGGSLAGLEFRAVVQPQATAAPLQSQVSFVPTAGLPVPVQLSGLPLTEVGSAWSPLLNPLAQPLSGKAQIGNVVFTVPSMAQPGDTYGVQLVNADGAPDLRTQYDFAAYAGAVTVINQAAPVSQPLGFRGFRLQWYAGSGAQFTVESTTDLIHGTWAAVATNLVGKGAALQFVDKNISDRARFYRVRQQ